TLPVLHACRRLDIAGLQMCRASVLELETCRSTPTVRPQLRSELAPSAHRRANNKPETPHSEARPRAPDKLYSRSCVAFLQNEGPRSRNSHVKGQPDAQSVSNQNSSYWN